MSFPCALRCNVDPCFGPSGTYPAPRSTVDAISSWQMQGKACPEMLRKRRPSTRRSKEVGVTTTGSTDVEWVASILYVPSQGTRAASSKTSEVAGIYHVQEMDGAGLGGLIDPSSRVLHPLSRCLHTSWSGS